MRADLFHAMQPFAAKNDARDYLCGVQLEPHPAGGILLIATNGCRMAIAHDPSGMHLDSPLLLPCVKAPKDVSRIVYNRGVLHGDNGWAQPVKEMTTFYPEWRRIIPNWEALSLAPTVLHPKYLKDWDKLAACFGKGTGVCVRTYHEKVTILTFSQGETAAPALGLIAPMRDMSTESGLAL